jgi:hypothetical protein
VCNGAIARVSRGDFVNSFFCRGKLKCLGIIQGHSGGLRFKLFADFLGLIKRKAVRFLIWNFDRVVVPAPKTKGAAQNCKDGVAPKNKRLNSCANSHEIKL